MEDKNVFRNYLALEREIDKSQEKFDRKYEEFVNKYSREKYYHPEIVEESSGNNRYNPEQKKNFSNRRHELVSDENVLKQKRMKLADFTPYYMDSKYKVADYYDFHAVYLENKESRRKLKEINTALREDEELRFKFRVEKRCLCQNSTILTSSIDVIDISGTISDSE